jgi:hypothetical protein
MLIVNIQNVQVSEITDPKNPQQKSSVLTYLNRQYVLVQIFPLDRLSTAQNLWRHLTDDRSQVCLIVKENAQYSVWSENIQQPAAKYPAAKDPIDPRLEFVFRTQMILINSLWSEVGELLGQAQSAAFGKEILASIPTISSAQDLHTAINVSKQSDKSIELYALSGRQLSLLYQDLQQLGTKYLGKNYTQEFLADFHKNLSPRLNQAFQNWLLKESHNN